MHLNTNKAARIISMVLDRDTIAAVLPAPKRLTQAFVKTELRAVGVNFKKTAYDDFRVNVAGHSEDMAYYTNDLSDALDTGREMARLAEKQAADARARVSVLPVTATPEIEPTAAPADKTRYNLVSSEMVYAPGIVKWAQNGYHFKKDRKYLRGVISSGWNLPDDVAHRICMGEGEVRADVYSIEV